MGAQAKQASLEHCISMASQSGVARQAVREQKSLHNEWGNNESQTLAKLLKLRQKQANQG